MKTALPVAFAAVLLSGCSMLPFQSSDKGRSSTFSTTGRPITTGTPSANAAPANPAGAPGTAVAQLPTTIQRAAETAWAGRDYGAAASHYSVLYQREPNNLQFAARYAEAARRSGDAKTAAELLDKLVGQGLGGAPLQIEMAKANLQIGRGGVALTAARQAVATEPGLAESHVVLGLALDAVGEHRAAAAAYQEALAKGAPGSARILNNLALSLAQAGKLDESVTALRKASRLDGELTSISQNLNLIEEIAGGSSAVKPQRISAQTAAPEGAPEARVQPRGITLSDAHRRVPPSSGGNDGLVAVSSPTAVRIVPPAAGAEQAGAASRPDLDQIATTMAAMRGRMDQLALPVAKTSAPPSP